jgi:hypothetical protein
MFDTIFAFNKNDKIVSLKVITELTFEYYALNQITNDYWYVKKEKSFTSEFLAIQHLIKIKRNKLNLIKKKSKEIELELEETIISLNNLKLKK